MAENVRGWSDLKAALEAIAKRAPDEMARALYEEAQIERTEAMRRCPVDTGSLRSSHLVEKPIVAGNEISVSIVCGGPAAPYALYVHENLDADHPVGEAKWLENTINESKPHMAERLSKRIDLNRMAGK